MGAGEGRARAVTADLSSSGDTVQAGTGNSDGGDVLAFVLALMIASSH
jgi:hypothetical protein